MVLKKKKKNLFNCFMNSYVGVPTSLPFLYYRFNDENHGEKKMLPQYDDPAAADEVFCFFLLEHVYFCKHI